MMDCTQTMADYTEAMIVLQKKINDLDTRVSDLHDTRTIHAASESRCAREMGQLLSQRDALIAAVVFLDVNRAHKNGVEK